MHQALACRLVTAVLAAACSVAAPAVAPAPTTVTATPLAVSSPSSSPTPTPTPTPTPSPSPPTAPPPAQPSPAPSPSPTPDPPRPTERIIVEQDWTPFATAAGVTLHHPSRRVELIGFHESTHEGAQQMHTTPEASPWVTMETRERGSPSRSAADIVVDPTTEIRSPVTGTVKRAGSYTLYCDHTDHYLVITPDGHTDFEVKILHFEGLSVRAGDRVEAGVTKIGTRAKTLPFESQVDEHTATPAWPHIHVELVDTTIPNIPGDGPDC